MKSSSRASNPFRSITSPLPSPLVMVCTPSRVGDVEHHQHAMTAPGLRLSAEPSAHYLSSGAGAAVGVNCKCVCSRPVIRPSRLMITASEECHNRTHQSHHQAFCWDLCS